LGVCQAEGKLARICQICQSMQSGIDNLILGTASNGEEDTLSID
jgi:hypothetical protein